VKLYIGLNEAYSQEGVIHPSATDQDFIRTCLLFDFYPTSDMIETRTESIANLFLSKYYDNIADSVVIDAPSFLTPFLYIAFTQYGVPVYFVTEEWGLVYGKEQREG